MSHTRNVSGETASHRHREDIHLPDNQKGPHSVTARPCPARSPMHAPPPGSAPHGRRPGITATPTKATAPAAGGATLTDRATEVIIRWICRRLLVPYR
jgi:hypothetical protein